MKGVVCLVYTHSVAFQSDAMRVPPTAATKKEPRDGPLLRSVAPAKIKKVIPGQFHVSKKNNTQVPTEEW